MAKNKVRKDGLGQRPQSWNPDDNLALRKGEGEFLILVKARAWGHGDKMTMSAGVEKPRAPYRHPSWHRVCWDQARCSNATHMAATVMESAIPSYARVTAVGGGPHPLCQRDSLPVFADVDSRFSCLEKCLVAEFCASLNMTF